MLPDRRVCRDCRAEKSLDDFYMAGNYPGSYCKECARLRTSRDYEQNREARREQQKALGRKVRYGLSSEDFQRLLDAQNGLCAICRQPEIRKRGETVWDLSVDHDHQSGKVRGLLCNRCNLIVGMSKDNPMFLLAAADYLLSSESTDTYPECVGMLF